MPTGTRLHLQRHNEHGVSHLVGWLTRCDSMDVTQPSLGANTPLVPLSVWFLTALSASVPAA